MLDCIQNGTPPVHSAYQGSGKMKDSVASRLAHTQRLGTLPVLYPCAAVSRESRS